MREEHFGPGTLPMIEFSMYWIEPITDVLSVVFGFSRNSWKCSIFVNESVDMIENFGDQGASEDNDDEILEVRSRDRERKSSPGVYTPG